MSNPVAVTQVHPSPSCMIFLPPQSRASTCRLSRCLSVIQEGFPQSKRHLVVICFSSALARHAASYACVDEVIQCPEAYWDTLSDMLQGKVSSSPLLDVLKEHICDDIVVPYVRGCQPLWGFLSAHLGLKLAPACMAVGHDATLWGAALAPSWMFPVARNKGVMLPVVCFEFIASHSPEIGSKPSLIKVIRDKPACDPCSSRALPGSPGLAKEAQAHHRIASSTRLQSSQVMRCRHVVEQGVVKAGLVFVLGAGLDALSKANLLIDYANQLGASVLATQGAYDRGLVNSDVPVIGQSGFKLEAAYYVGFGVSGAIQHMAGLAGSVGRVVVVNTKPEVELLSQADLLVISSLEEVLFAFKRCFSPLSEKQAIPLVHE